MNEETTRFNLDELFNLTLGMSLDAQTWATKHEGRGKRFIVLTFTDLDGEEAVVALAPQPSRGPQFFRMGLSTNLPEYMKPIIAGAGKDRKVSVSANSTADQLWENLSEFDGPRARIAFLYAVGSISFETAEALMADPKNRVMIETEAGDWEIEHGAALPAKRERKAAPAPVAPPKPKTERDNPAWGLL